MPCSPIKLSLRARLQRSRAGCETAKPGQDIHWSCIRPLRIIHPTRTALIMASATPVTPVPASREAACVLFVHSSTLRTPGAGDAFPSSGGPQQPVYALAIPPAGRGSGTSWTVDSGSLGPPPHSRRSTGITSVANRCIWSSTSSVLYPPPSNHAVKKKSW